MCRSSLSYSLYSVFINKIAAAVFIFLMISSASVVGEPLQAQPGEVLALDHTSGGDRLHVVALFSPDGGEIGRFQSFAVPGQSFSGRIAPPSVTPSSSDRS